MCAYAFGLSDVGRKRQKNEDQYLIDPELGLYVVADGMGGHAGGDTASRLAVQTLVETLKSQQEILEANSTQSEILEDNAVAKILSDALKSACHVVYRRGQVESTLQGMGTTATALLLHGDHAFIGHVGDSRAYLVRQNQIMQLSEDHSLVNEQVKAGLLTPEQARQSRYRNIITRSIGFEYDVDVDMMALKALPGDTFLLCSDGLTTLLADQEIRNILIDNFLYEAPQLLVNLANHRGGDDNITVIVIHVVSKADMQSGALNEKQIRLSEPADQMTTIMLSHEENTH